MSERLFDTWEGDNSTLEEDLSRVLTHKDVSVVGLDSDQLSQFLAKTLVALQEAEGSTPDFLTTMFMLYKNLELRPRRFYSAYNDTTVPI